MKSIQKVLLFLLLLITGTSLIYAQWPGSVIIPVPSDYPGVEGHITSLNGTWQISVEPTEDQWYDPSLVIDWDDMVIPGRSLRKVNVRVYLFFSHSQNSLHTTRQKLLKKIL